MMLGLPVVATSVGGVPGIVVDEQTGLLVPAGDAPALAAALGRLVRSSALRDRVGAAAARHAAGAFNAERTAKQYLRLYRSLATGESRAVAGAHYRDMEV
jgi:glycosyltransferase involved in cell wall biosynthesis